MKFILLIGLFIIGFTNNKMIEAQNISIIPPSPVSAEFAKYINQEVSLYNGIPEISIPLYTIQLKGGLTIPLSLSYHASGIKFGQDDGFVGLGWVFNPGYRISRTIYSYADELNPMPSYIVDSLNYYNNGQFSSGLSNEEKFKRDRFISKFLPELLGTNLAPTVDQRFDGAYDQFLFSIPNSGGSFIISDRENKVITTTEDSNLKFDFKTGESLCMNDNGIKGFQIIDDAGIIYAFGEYNPQNECIREALSSFYQGFVSTAWGISEIYTQLGDSVKFNYLKANVGGISYDYCVQIIESYSLGPQMSTPDVFENFTNYYDTFSPQEIITSNEGIEIQYEENTYYSKKIKKINIKSKDSQLLKSIEFFYSSKPKIGAFLDSVVISDSEDLIVETYRFDYYSKNETTNYTMDQNGYFLPRVQNTASYGLHEEFSDDVYYDQGRSQSVGSQFATISREPITTPNFFSIKRITYPTGGYTEFDYESGRYSGTEQVKNAGIRIKTIRSYDSQHRISLERSYKYGIDENGLGETKFLIDAGSFVNEEVFMDFNEYPPLPPGLVRRKISYSFNMQRDAGTMMGLSSFIKYPCVTEYYSDSWNLRNGKTTYYYELGNLFEASTIAKKNTVPNSYYSFDPSSARYIDKYRLWDKPMLNKKITFSFENGQYNPVEEEIFTYRTKVSNVFKGLKAKQSAYLSPSDELLSSSSYYSFDYFGGYFLDSYFDFNIYTIETGKKELSGKKVYNYYPNDTIVTQYHFEYSNHLLSKETITNSKGGVTINYTLYPLNYASGTTFIDNMVSNNLINYPIEKVSLLKNGSVQKVISGSVTKYKAGGKGLPDSQWLLKIDNPVNINSFKFSNVVTGNLPFDGTTQIFSTDNLYSEKISFDNYDSKGNLLEYHKESDIIRSYIWGYKEIYPVVEGGNISHIDLENVLSTTLNNLGYDNLDELLSEICDISVPENKALWKSFNSELRILLISLFPESYISTYTYDPLIGMTSKTDPNGFTTYYQYDNFGRLKYIKDNEGNILEQYEYHYKNQ